ncbi:peptidase S8/S53 domain-containing protein [Lactarius sanguifluus]|nr:peptidase S8/S53 domain-containing protein [Lactarius sanguifluus]
MRCHALSVLAILSALFLCGFVTPFTSRWDGMKVKHAWDTVPKNWKSLGHPSNETTIDLHLALKSHHQDALIEALYEVSDPEHSRYGAHFTKEQVADVVSPHPDTVELVSSWLGHYDIPSSSTSMTLGGNWLRVVGVSVSRANRILGASYQLYQHVETNDTVLRTISYSLPEVLQWAHTNDPPDDLLQFSAHGDNETTDALQRGSQGTGEGGFPSPQDLALFMKEYRTDGEDATYTVTQANLDIQYAEAMAYPTRHIYYSTAGTPNSPTDDPYLCWLCYVIAQDDVDIPRTISTSYGGYEYNIPPEYAESVCTLFGQLGLRGVSILFSSGDRGVGDGDCLFRDSSGELYVQFLPVFPATCPWVTSIGGTTGHDPEVTASISGGGFSMYFPRQPYQANVASTFFQNFGDKYSGLYNPEGHGFPDISSQAIKFFLILGGQFRLVSGTSGAAPVHLSLTVPALPP